MKWKNRELPFLGYHKSHKSIVRLVRIGANKWLIGDLVITLSHYSLGSCMQFREDYYGSSEISSKFYELSTLTPEEKIETFIAIFGQVVYYRSKLK